MEAVTVGGTMAKEKLTSEKLENLIGFLVTAAADYEWNCDKMQLCEGETQDYLHKLELEHGLYDDRAKIATRLAECRRQRRQHKDMMEELAAVHELVDSEYGKQMLKKLRDCLGATRKAEQKHRNRVYVPKVLDEPVIIKKDGKRGDVG